MTKRSCSLLVCAVQVFFSLLLYAQAEKQSADIIVTGIVVTMDGSRSIYDDGAVAISGDTILAVGQRAEVESRFAPRQAIDARGKLVLPGFINGHTHVPMTLFRGLHDDVTLNDWLYKYIFPAEAKNVTEEFVRWERDWRRPSKSDRESRPSPTCITSKMQSPKKPRRLECGEFWEKRSLTSLLRTTRATRPCSLIRKSFCRSGKAIR